LQLQLAELGVAADFELVERLRRFPDVAVSVGPKFSVARDVAGRLSLRAQLPIGFKVKELIVNLTGRAGEVSFAGVHFRWSHENVKGAGRLSPRAGHELFDADKVGGRITLRHWQAGDRFQPIGLKSAVKLQDLFTNQKIPRARRHNLIVAEAANGRIFWVEQLRMAEPFKLTPVTKRRLIWRWQANALEA
jgi:tRNA(Ile)-lysidine synthase